MEYYILFDENGRKGETYMIDQFLTEEEENKLITRGFKRTSEDDFKLYAFEPGKNGTGYIRGADGKPTDAPAYVPTKDELAQKLYNECVKDIRAIESDIVMAIAAKDDEMLAVLREERRNRIADYQRDLEELGA